MSRMLKQDKPKKAAHHSQCGGQWRKGLATDLSL